MTAPRRIVLLAYPDCQALGLTGPMEVFAMARREDPCALLDRGGRSRRSAFATNSGLRLAPDRSPQQVGGPTEMLVVAGGSRVGSAVGDRGLVGWVAEASTRSRRLASVCTRVPCG